MYAHSTPMTLKAFWGAEDFELHKTGSVEYERLFSCSATTTAEGGLNAVMTEQAASLDVGARAIKNEVSRHRKAIRKHGLSFSGWLVNVSLIGA